MSWCASGQGVVVVRRESDGPVGGGGVVPTATGALGAAVAALEAMRAAEVAFLDAVGRVHAEVTRACGQITDGGLGAAWRRVDVDATVADELVCATGESGLFVRAVVDLVTSDPARLDCGRSAVIQGRASLRRVLDWHAATDHLPQDVAVTIGQEVLTRGSDGSPRSGSSFRRLLGRRVRQAETADRAAARARRTTAIAGRGSWARAGQDGTGSLTVVGEATRVAGAWSRLDNAARRAKAAGDARTLGQLRSDLHLDLLLVGQLPDHPNTGAPAYNPTPATGAPGSAGSDPATDTPTTGGAAVSAGGATAGAAGGAGSGRARHEDPDPADWTVETPHATPGGSDRAGNLAARGAAPEEGTAPRGDTPAPGPTAPVPPVCTSCGTVAEDYFPIPRIGDPVLPPARCTVVVGLDVLLENTPKTDTDTDSSSTGPSGTGQGLPPTHHEGQTPPGAAPPDGPGDAVPTPGPTADAGTPSRGGGGLLGAPLGWMPGFGYLDAEHVRAVTVREGSVWQRLVADPTTGHAVTVSPHTYRPTASVARFVRARDGIARDPGTGEIPADRCELDHLVPFDHGGPTTPDNLQSLSRKGHTRKTKRQWTAQAHPDGTIHWTSLLGQRYTTTPHDYRNP